MNMLVGFSAYNMYLGQNGEIAREDKMIMILYSEYQICQDFIWRIIFHEDRMIKKL
jgi:hypothetical protein